MKNLILTACFLFLGLLFSNITFSQSEKLELSLTEIISLAQSDAPDVLINKARLSNSFWQLQAANSLLRPTINFTSDLPDLNRNIDIVTLPTGRDTFIQRAQMRTNVGLQLSQQIPWTGGSVFASTNLQRLDLFNDTFGGGKSYFSTPISVGFRQPIFGFNELKWDQKIQPLVYQEATKQFAENMEGVAFEAAQLFFEVYIAQLNLTAATQDKANADTLLNISKGRFEVGRIAETELLQIELSAMNANANVAQAVLDLTTSSEQLRNFLGIKQKVEFELTPPTEIPEFIVDADAALKYALQNRSEIIGFERRKIEAESDVARAQANSGLNADIFATFSLSKTTNELSDAYTSPLNNNERFSLGLNVPIADWGRARSRLEVAKSNQEVTNMLIEQERISFEQEILLKVQQFDLLRNQVALALRAYDVSQKRQEMTRNRYYIGKIGITELGIAISEQESARRGYMNALRAFWLAFYELRQITLFDFERNVSLVKKIDFTEN
jgi:outer membrane protein TolC